MLGGRSIGISRLKALYWLLWMLLLGNCPRYCIWVLNGPFLFLIPAESLSPNLILPQHGLWCKILYPFLFVHSRVYVMYNILYLFLSPGNIVLTKNPVWKNKSFGSSAFHLYGIFPTKMNILSFSICPNKFTLTIVSLLLHMQWLYNLKFSKIQSPPVVKDQFGSF